MNRDPTPHGPRPRRRKENTMKKQITEISMLTGDLYYDYVQPAAIAAGITEEVPAHHDTWGDYTTYHVDAAAADEIGHCMYCACMNAHIALHQYGSEAEARQMLYQLEVSIKYHPETAELLTALRNAIAAMLPQQPQAAPAAEAEQQPTETENAPQAATQAAQGTTTTNEQKEEDKTMSTTANELQKYVDGIAADLRKLYEADPTDEEREAAEETGDACDLYSYFSDVLDIEYTISSRGDYLGARIAVALGGPNIYIDTREGYVKGYWGTDKEEAWIPSEICEEINDIMEEYYEMVRGA